MNINSKKLQTLKNAEIVIKKTKCEDKGNPYSLKKYQVKCIKSTNINVSDSNISNMSLNTHVKDFVLCKRNVKNLTQEGVKANEIIYKSLETNNYITELSKAEKESIRWNVLSEKLDQGKLNEILIKSLDETNESYNQTRIEKNNIEIEKNNKEIKKLEKEISQNEQTILNLKNSKDYQNPTVKKNSDKSIKELSLKNETAQKSIKDKKDQNETLVKENERLAQGKSSMDKKYYLYKNDVLNQKDVIKCEAEEVRYKLDKKITSTENFMEDGSFNPMAMSDGVGFFTENTGRLIKSFLFTSLQDQNRIVKYAAWIADVLGCEVKDLIKTTGSAEKEVPLKENAGVISDISKLSIEDEEMLWTEAYRNEASDRILELKYVTAEGVRKNFEALYIYLKYCPADTKSNEDFDKFRKEYVTKYTEKENNSVEAINAGMLMFQKRIEKATIAKFKAECAELNITDDNAILDHAMINKHTKLEWALIKKFTEECAVIDEDMSSEAILAYANENEGFLVEDRKYIAKFTAEYNQANNTTTGFKADILAYAKEKSFTKEDKELQIRCQKQISTLGLSYDEIEVELEQLRVIDQNNSSVNQKNKEAEELMIKTNKEREEEEKNQKLLDKYKNTSGLLKDLTDIVSNPSDEQILVFAKKQEAKNEVNNHEEEILEINNVGNQENNNVQNEEDDFEKLLNNNESNNLLDQYNDQGNN